MSRKERKRKRKNKGSPPISNGANLRELAKILTKQASARLKSLPINDRFLWHKCKKVYCVNFVGKDSYCSTCFYKKGCRKDIKDIRTCSLCKGDK